MKKLMKIGLAAALLATPVLLPFTAHADTPVVATAGGDQKTQPADSTPAGRFIQQLGNKAIGIIADQSLSQDQRSQKYDGLLRDAFDLQTIGRFVLGRAWNTATQQQRDEYMRLFETNVVKMYGARLSFYSGESFKVKTERREDESDIIVTSEIDHPDGTQPTMVDWRVRESGGRNAIIDVIIEGVSQSVTQRQEYASIIERNGGNIDALLDMMRQRSAAAPQAD